MFYLEGGDDYQPISSQPLTLSAGTTSACVTVFVVNDTEAEPALEFFSLVLSSSDPDVIIPTPLADAAIENDDSEKKLTLLIFNPITLC